MMKQKKILSLLLALALALSMLAGCGNTAAPDVQQPAEPNVAGDTVTDENAVAAQQLLVDLTGTYQELWPVILDEQYTQLWLDNCAALVGEENAQTILHGHRHGLRGGCSKGLCQWRRRL